MSASHRFAFRPQDFSDAEIAIIELPPPFNERNKEQFNSLDSSSNSQDSNDGNSNSDNNNNNEFEAKPITLAFPISGKLSNGQFGQVSWVNQ